MKVLAFTVLHYGSEYLDYAIRSVKDHVNEHLISYTPLPSFGYSSNLQNPDSEQDLKAICDKYPHIVWESVKNVMHEHIHRERAFHFARKHGYDVVIVVDSDEVWNPDKVQEAIDYAAQSKAGHFCVMGSQWITLWKSFNEYVQDGFAPVRLFNMHNDLTVSEHIDKGFIYHMGYCISDELMRYKISCHGHKSDFEKNKKWFTEKWVGYQSGVTKFLHPATEAYWQEAQPFDKTQLPDILKKHNNYNK